MKNPLGLLKKGTIAVVKMPFNMISALVRSPLKIIITTVATIDQLITGAAAKERAQCKEVIFTPTGSGMSYTMEIAHSDCDVLRGLAATESSLICLKALNKDDSISISSLSDIPRPLPGTGISLIDTIGFFVEQPAHDDSTGAIVASGQSRAVKIFNRVRNPHCASMSFYSRDGGLPAINDVSPGELRHIVEFLDNSGSRGDDRAEHCGSGSLLSGRRCRTELR